MSEEPTDYKAQLAEVIKTRLDEVEKVLAKRSHEAGPSAPNKAPCSMFTKLFGTRRQSVTREDFDQTWERLEQRKEHYKARTEELTTRLENKDSQIDSLERRVKELEKQLGKKQKNAEQIRIHINNFYKNVEQNYGGCLGDSDDEVETKGSVDDE